MTTLGISSDIYKKKTKFFINRALIYTSFLLIPVLLPKSVDASPQLLHVMFCIFVLFMFTQWFMLGKEIDYRLKIFFRVNSSIDRIVYRVLLGKIFLILFFYLVSFLTDKWINNVYWSFWAILGLFYSWPTRGKIIQESVSSNLGEYKFLDSFERTLLGLILLMFFISMPELPRLSSEESLKLFYDPNNSINPIYWSFLHVSYIPFLKHGNLLKLSYGIHFYVVVIGIYLVAFYALLRYFFSRRLSLLGIFALISTWSIPKILIEEPGQTLTSTYSLFLIWSFLWVVKSSTYRSGLFWGLVNFYGVLLNHGNIFLIIPQLIAIFYITNKDQTTWYKKQHMRYMLLGVFLSAYAFISDWSNIDFSAVEFNFFKDLFILVNRKSFYILSVFGLLLLAFDSLRGGKLNLGKLSAEKSHLSIILLGFLVIIVNSAIFGTYLDKSFSILWILNFLCLIPIELVFNSMNRHRSARNMVYLIYIIACVLDSHFEGRVKIFLKYLKSLEWY
jgi:hypothetical protein